MTHQANDHGLDFGHEFHGREHHFRLTRAALEFLADESALDETAMVNTYNANLPRIHRVAERLSRTSDAGERVMLERSAFEPGAPDGA